MDVVFAPQVLKAISLVKKILFNENVSKSIFKELVEQFVSDITDDELDNILDIDIHIFTNDVMLLLISFIMLKE